MRPLTVLILASVITLATGDARAQNATAPIRIRGYCVDEQGKGIEGAEVFLAEYAIEHRRLAQTTTGRDGLFEFVDVAMPYRKGEENRGTNRGMFQVFGLADGFGFAWLPISRFDPNPPKAKVVDVPIFDVSPLPQYYGGSVIELKLVFPKAQTLSGRVVDDQGRPIAGASLVIRYCDREVGQADYSKSGGPGAFDVLNETEIVPPDVKTRKTDIDGQFKFSALPPDCRLQVDIRTPDRFRRSVWLATQKGLKADGAGTPVYSEGAEIAFPKMVRVRVQVTFSDTEKPAENVLVTASNKEGSSSGISGSLGEVEMRVPAGEYTVQVLPRTGMPYAGARKLLRITENMPVLRFTLTPAAVVEVTVTDVKTGIGLKGVDLWIESSNGARTEHYFPSYEPDPGMNQAERRRTNTDGKLTAFFSTGRYRIGIAMNSWPNGYQVVEPAHQDVDCRPGEPTRIKFQMTRDAVAP